MAYFVGKTGYLSIDNFAGSSAVRYHLEEWGLELEVEEVEFSNFETYGMKSVLGGMRGGTVSGSGVLEGTSAAAALTLAYNIGVTSPVVTIDLGLVASGTPPLVGIQVKAVITGFTINNNVKEKPTFEFKATLTNIDPATTLANSTQNQTLAIV